MVKLESQAGSAAVCAGGAAEAPPDNQCCKLDFCLREAFFSALHNPCLAQLKGGNSGSCRQFSFLQRNRGFFSSALSAILISPMALLGVWHVLLFFCITFFLLLIWRRRPEKGNLPPGPTPLPLLGNLLQMDLRNVVGSFRRLQERYGPVFTLYMGSRPVVVVCGYEAIKEALVENMEVSSGRGYLPVLDDAIRNYGVVFTNGERWRQLRRFSLTTLRNFGMGKRSIEERIQEEAQFLVEAIRKTGGHTFDPTFYISNAVSNVICSVVFGNRFEYDDKDFVTLLGLLNQLFRLAFSPWAQLVNFFPFLKRLLPAAHRDIELCVTGLKSFVSQRIRLHRQSFDANCPRDFIDCFLAKMEQEPNSEFFDDTMNATVLNMFFAGTETVSSTTRYGLLILLRYPEVEAKIQEEIDQVIGRNRSPCMEDRSRMPYTDAIIHEIQRFGDILPLGLPHLTLENTQFRGFTIPKDTTILPLLTTALNDPQHFETPRRFNPGHFLDENGAFKKNEAFIPFSTGKRICLGEGLARMELFLFLTTLLQNFTLKSLQDRKEINLTPQMQNGLKLPKPYYLCMIPR